VSTKTLIKRMNAARRFPANTCGASRHAQDIAEAMMRGRCATVDVSEHSGESIAATVTALWEARTKIASLTAERDAARRDGMSAAASILEAEHDKRSHIDNHAAYYARMIREAIGERRS
jgi:hypothetical protein